MPLTLPGYTVSKTHIYSGLYTILFSGIRDQDKSNVVIKLLKNEHPSFDDIVRFKHEYEVAKLCESDEDIVHVFKLEKHDTSYAIVMENINTPTLAEVLEIEKKFKVEDFLELAVHMAESLGHIHQHGIIHKDINPSNIMCNLGNKQLKIIDFGLSATLPKEHAEILSPNVLEGTLPYLSPEQTGRMNRGIDYRTDYYSLGVVFYQMLTGQLPFNTQDPMELVHAHIALIPKAPHEIDSNIPQILSEIVMKLLSKKAEDRYQNANGLIADLQECYRQQHEYGIIKSFNLGTQDIFSRFQIPEKLYGRENEVKTLMNAYDRVMEGKVELMLVAGYSGIGKSALVHEVHKPIVAKHGYFISGKFDQFKHNIPYAAVAQSFDEFVKQILTEPEDRIEIFRKKILDSVGENGKIIIDVIPNLATIIGEQPEVPELGPAESQNRFSYVFQNFIKGLCSVDHPLVIFLDDLQWADLASLKMLDTLMTSPDCQYLFIMGAYRSNEVNPSHPLIMILDDLKKRNVSYGLIELGPLALGHVTELLADTVHQEQESVQSLSRICYEKTGGNPFFLIQLLFTLYKEQLIEFDAKKNEWTWHTDKIQEKEITANVVDLMINKLQQLPLATQNALKLAACIGNQFELTLLSSICKQDPGAVLIELQEALKEGYIVSHGESYRAVKYYFAHDRIQQAAHQMIDDNERSLVHVELARLILEKTREEKLEEVIFNVANHYNIGIESKIFEKITKEEKQKIAKLNLLAAKAAKAAAAFDPALKYLEYGMRCVEQDEWNNNYPFMMELYTEATETAYLSSKYDLMDKYADEGLKKAKSIHDELKIIQTRVLSNVVRMKQRAAVDLVKNTLSRLGIKLPSEPNMVHILANVMKVKWLLWGKKIPDLINLPEMTDKTKKAIVRLISMVYSSAYQVQQNMLPIFVCTNIELSLRYGNTIGSAYSYAFYGVLSCGVLGEIENGYQFGELAIKLVDKINDLEGKTKVYMANYSFIKHWKDPLRMSLPKLVENFQNGLDIGDIEYACYSIMFNFVYSYLASKPLKEVIKESQTNKIYIDKLQQSTASNYLSIYLQTMLNLVEKKDNPELLIGSAYNEVELLPFCIKINDRSAIWNIYNTKLVLLYLFEKPNEFLKYIELADKFIDAVPGVQLVCVYNLFKALALLTLYSSSSYFEKRKFKNIVNKIERNLKKWAKYAPYNNSHKYFLLKAEISWRIKGKFDEAAIYFEQAIELARKHDYLNETALANELCAKFYLAQNKEKIARIYMDEACYYYRIWGADAKVEYLENHYPQLISKTKKEVSANLSVSTSASDRTASQVLDMSAIQKSSQAISSTIVLKELLKRLMQIVIENAGAQRSFLLLNKKGEYVIEAEADVQNKEVQVLQSISINNEILCVSIVNYVIRTKEFIVLDDAIRSEQFMNDPYVEKTKQKSILCMPLLNQGVLSGILYMENNLTEGAFTKDRIETLNLLSSQIAISIDNARLYSNTKELNEQLIVLNSAYERFVPNDFLSLLEKKSIVDVDLGDQVQESMSVLFTDIRNFTTLSESMSPQENFNFINSFLSVMGPVIRKHNGFVDKYIGDAIMALYPRSADDAVLCALEMQKALQQFNKQRTEKGEYSIAIGIGINTGTLMLGTVGEAHRMNATVISDAVNIASRVESLTKNYKVDILITEDTYNNLKNPTRYKMKIVDNQVLVKGKTKPISVYQVQDR